MKKTLKPIFVFCLIISIMTIGISSTVFACSCAEAAPVEEQLNRSDAVFSGRVLEVKEQRSWKGYTHKAVLFEVNEIWKGGLESQIIVYTGSGGGDCGFPFETGKEYLVYASLSNMYNEDKELLSTGICRRTTILAEAQEDIAILGEGEKPTKQVKLEYKFSHLYRYQWVILIGMVVLGFIILMGWRKRRQ